MCETLEDAEPSDLHGPEILKMMAYVAVGGEVHPLTLPLREGESFLDRLRKEAERMGDADTVMYILAPKTHPLIDGSLLKMANDAFDAADRNTRFGIIQIDAKDESFDVKMPAV